MERKVKEREGTLPPLSWITKLWALRWTQYGNKGEVMKSKMRAYLEKGVNHTRPKSQEKKLLKAESWGARLEIEGEFAFKAGWRAAMREVRREGKR